MFFLASGSYLQTIASPAIPDYTGSWLISFYDASGKLIGGKTIVVNEDGSISDKTNMSIGTIVYLTEISGSVTPKGTVTDGSLTDTYKLDMTGVLTGNFTESQGSGTWKNYYDKSGTWKAVRPAKDDKR